MSTQRRPVLDVAKVIALVNRQRPTVRPERGGLFFSEGTHQRQKRSVEERRAGTGVKLTAFQRLVARLVESRGVEEPTPGALPPPVPVDVLIAALQVKCPRDTGALSESLTAVWTGDHYEVSTPGIPYGRIQDLGGRAGKNGSALLAGHFYLAKAAAAIGVDARLVQWAEVPDA